MKKNNPNIFKETWSEKEKWRKIKEERALDEATRKMNYSDYKNIIN